MDKIRRAIFTISAEGASLFEWAIWTTLLTFVIGLPITIAILQSFVAIIIPVITGIVLFVFTSVLLGITDYLLRIWRYEISDEELKFEEEYLLRITDD